MTSGSASATSGTTRTKTHDPLCPVRAKNFVPEDECPECSLICRCDLLAEVRTDERTRWKTPYWSQEYHQGYRQGQQDERQRWVTAISERIQDLKGCGKDDDCDIKAEGAWLALDDGLTASHEEDVPTAPTPPPATSAPKSSNPKVAYAQGYLDALAETSWTCPDCGNIYDPDVTDCPNRYFDEAKVALRTAQRKAGETSS